MAWRPALPLGPGAGAWIAVHVVPEPVTRFPPPAPEGSPHSSAMTQELADGQATEPPFAVAPVTAAGSLRAVQVVPEPVSNRAWRWSDESQSRPVTTQALVEGQAIAWSMSMDKTLGGSGASAGVQEVPNPVSRSPWRSRDESSYWPTAVQEVAEGQAID